MRFEFTGIIIEWRGPAPFYFVELPTEIAAEIKDLSASLTYGWGVIPVRLQIDGLETTTSLIPRYGGYYLPIKNALRVPLGLEVNQEIAVLLTV